MAGMSVPAAPLLSVEGLEVTFGTDAPAVCGVDLAVRSGQTVAVVGESGSGKSTTAAAILGLLPAGGRITAGRVVFDGRDITGADAKRLRSIRGREIGYVPQDPMTNLNPVWKVGFQVTEALRANTDGRAARRRAVELLAEAGLPDPAKQAGRYPHQLSGGMCQRALIAIGLAGRPRLLIADEPTSALDVTVQRQVLDHLQGLTDELGTALLLITHDLALAAQRAEAVVVVRRGVVVESGAAQSILQSPQHEYTRRLVAAAPSLTARSRRPPESRSRATTQAGDILVVSELTKIYRESRGAPWRRVESRAVDGVSFRLPRASTLAIVGESGSGKSTLARMVLGLLQPTSGTVVFDGTYDVGALARDQVLAFRRRVQPVFQNPYSSLDPMYSVFRAIEEPLRVHHVGDRRQRQRAVRELVDQVALPSSILGRRPRELSGGQRQRVAIARALALRPEVLVCDEAVSALDVLVQAQILDLLADLQALARLHMLAAADQVDDDRLGRPRSDADVGPRLELLADVVTHPTLASAPVVAAVAHGELLTLRPFGCADGVVARAVSRLVTIATGLDPHGLGVPEVIWMRQPAEYHDAARRFAGGTPDGVAGWLLLCCGAMLDGAREALSIAESLSPG
ncbi:dipeptide-transport ATP-binding protein ABC transporter DPPD [Mycobacterium tuberculosis]|nr:dipeptide-transport ATP-binding protein ABC transporter DPPD [Mycobacterium tuberculosis]